MLGVVWKSGLCFFELCRKNQTNKLKRWIQQYYTKYKQREHVTPFLCCYKFCFSILDEFNLQKLLNFLLHPSLSRINAEFSPLRLKAVKENENIENTEIWHQMLLMSNHDMFSLESNCDSYMTAFTHGRLSYWNMILMMGSVTSVVETLVQHDFLFCSSAKIEEPNKHQYSASFHQI